MGLLRCTLTQAFLGCKGNPKMIYSSLLPSVSWQSTAGRCRVSLDQQNSNVYNGHCSVWYMRFRYRDWDLTD